ncbi:enoyl-CoA hydratase/isomerase family protein [Chloroflexota bacterium]
MSYETIIYEKEGGIATLTFNRPQVMNAMDYQMAIVEMPAAIEEARNDDEVRVLIVTGAGRGFCAGDDVKARFLAKDRDKHRAEEKIAELKGIRQPSYFVGFYKPTIAAVNGPAVGGGLDLALSCDIRLASENAKFGYLFVQRSLMGRAEPLMMLIHIVGLSRALEMMYSGELMGAAEAEKVGLVSRVVTQDRLMDEARELAHKLMKGAPLAQQAIKQAVYKALFNPSGLTEFASLVRMLLGETEDHREGARAFAEKRDPVYKGK